MKRETTVWWIVLLLGALGLVWRASTAPHGVGTVYVVPKIAEPSPAEPADEASKPVRYRLSTPNADGAILSIERTIGTWLAALLTLGVFSYLFHDNPLYKLTESVVVGVSAGYTFVVGFWDNLVAKLLLRLTPQLVHEWAIPLREGESSTEQDLSYLVPLFLGIMLFFRFVPRMGWISVWPLAFVVGTTAGLKLIVFIEADFIGQIQNTMMPLVIFVYDQSGSRLDLVSSIGRSVRNMVFVLGVLTSLTYFYFSVEHKGVVRQVARCGIWVLMITFGSSFAFTVMGRIALLTVRLEFLLGRWLGLIEVT